MYRFSLRPSPQIPAANLQTRVLGECRPTPVLPAPAPRDPSHFFISDPRASPCRRAARNPVAGAAQTCGGGGGGPLPASRGLPGSQAPSPFSLALNGWRLSLWLQEEQPTLFWGRYHPAAAKKTLERPSPHLHTPVLGTQLCQAGSWLFCPRKPCPKRRSAPHRGQALPLPVPVSPTLFLPPQLCSDPKTQLPLGTHTPLGRPGRGRSSQELCEEGISRWPFKNVLSLAEPRGLGIPAWEFFQHSASCFFSFSGFIIFLSVQLLLSLSVSQLRLEGRGGWAWLSLRSEPWPGPAVREGTGDGVQEGTGEAPEPGRRPHVIAWARGPVLWPSQKCTFAPQEADTLTQ